MTGRLRQAAAEETVCAALIGDATTKRQDASLEELKRMRARNAYVWRGVYDNDRFDRHVRSYLRKLTKRAKTNAGFDNAKSYQ